MAIQFYKPTQKVTGSACSFSFNSKDECLYIQLVKQVGYDPAKRLGSFNGGEKVNLKFSMTEIGGMIDALERNVPFSAFHSSEARTGINFDPYIDKVSNLQKGFSLRINQTSGDNKISFALGFTFPEMVQIREYLKFVLEHCFSANYSADKKAYLDKVKKKEESAKATPIKKEEPKVEDPWEGEENPKDDF